MKAIKSFISKLSSHFLCFFNSRNNNTTIITTVDPEQGSELQQPVEAIQQPAAAAAARDSDGITVDRLRRTLKAAVPTALFIGATSAGLIINPVVVQCFSFLVAPYNVLLILSLFIGLGIPMYLIINIANIPTTDHSSSSSSSSSRISSDAELVMVVRVLMAVGSVSIFVALVLRGLMSQANYSSSVMLAWLLFFFIIIVGLIFLYLWMVLSKKKKRNNIPTVPTSEGMVYHEVMQ